MDVSGQSVSAARSTIRRRLSAWYRVSGRRPRGEGIVTGRRPAATRRGMMRRAWQGEIDKALATSIAVTKRRF